MLVKVGQLLEPGHHLPEQKLVAMMLLHLAEFAQNQCDILGTDPDADPDPRIRTSD